MNPLANYAKGQPRNVKTYTVCQESKYLIVTKVPDLNLLTELTHKLSEFGTVTETRYMDEKSEDQAHDTVLAKFESIDAARYHGAV